MIPDICLRPAIMCSDAHEFCEALKQIGLQAARQKIHEPPDAFQRRPCRRPDELDRHSLGFKFRQNDRKRALRDEIADLP